LRDENNTLFLFLTLTITARSQEKESFYIFDADWKPVKIELAHFALHIHNMNDTLWQWDYYNFMGPLIKTEQYRNSEGKIANGSLKSYNKVGFNDSVTTFQNGKRNGESWKLSGNSLKHKIRYIYQDDELVRVIDMDTVKKDSAISYKDEKESEYLGGIRAWFRYLSKNLKYPDRAVNGNIQGQVGIVFVVDKAGNVISPYIDKSVEYSLDEEALRIINNSGTWTPAFQNEHNVKSYKRQPINFKLE
jgi:protein TonB